MFLKDKVLIIVAIIFLILGILLIVSISSFGKFKVVACDVGQGDATLIVTTSGSQVLVDGGPGKKVLDCLGSYMPFWDRDVEMIVLTHPQKDHMEGLIAVLENYKVGTIVWTGVKAESGLFADWQNKVGLEKAKVINPRIGQTLMIDKVSFDVLWPSTEKIAEWENVAPADLNESSVVLRLNGQGFCMYLTGDITLEILEGFSLRPCEVLKISHHGSYTGTNEVILEKIKPKIALIEVGKSNSYGHPHPKVLDQLNSKGIQIYRTDTDGRVEITLDKGNFKIRQAN